MKFSIVTSAAFKAPPYDLRARSYAASTAHLDAEIAAVERRIVCSTLRLARLRAERAAVLSRVEAVTVG